MSWNVTHVQVLRSTLRIHCDNLPAAEALDLPPANPLAEIDDYSVDADGYYPIREFWWSGEGSGTAYRHTLDKFIALLQGEAELVFFWEGGESVTGYRITEDVAEETKVEIKLVMPNGNGAEETT